MKLPTFFVALLIACVFLSFAKSWRLKRRRRCLKRNCIPQSWARRPWNICTKSCGTGIQYRTRGIAVSAMCGGSCNAALRQTRYCNTHCCPSSCTWSWNAWSPCSGCGVSTQTRTLLVTRNPSCGGTACPSTQNQTRSCNTRMWVGKSFLFLQFFIFHVFLKKHWAGSAQAGVIEERKRFQKRKLEI